MPPSAPSLARAFLPFLLLGCAGAAWGGTWTLRNPLPTPDGLDAMVAVDAQLLYACGPAGQVFRSDDGGVTWTPRHPPTLEGLKGLAVVGRDTVFAAGTGGTLIRSVDGGASWSVRKGDFDTRFQSIAAPDGRTAFAVANAGVVFRTRDGGVTWDSLNCGVSSWLMSIAAVDRSHAWAASGHDTVFRTSDGGDNWVPHSVGKIATVEGGSGGLVALSAVDRDTVFAAAQESRRSVQYRAVFRTTDGGLNWARVDTAYGAVPYSISAPNGSTAFVGCFAAEIRTTHDGGATWRQVAAGYLNLGDFQSHRAISALDTRTAFATGNRSRVYATLDAGATWTLKNNPGPQANLRGLALTETGAAFACGTEGLVLKSSDYGSRWGVAKAAVANTGDLEDIASRDGVHVLAVGFGRALVSGDGGTTWGVGTLPNIAADRRLHALALTGVGDTAFTAGVGGLLLRSVDLGRTWMPQASGTAADLFALASAGPRTLFAAGDSGVLLRSQDGGVAWTRMGIPSVKRIRSLHFLDGLRGFAACDSGRVARTGDGGATWVFAQVEQTWNPIHVVFALDAMTVLAGGYRGALFRSEDAGVIWTPDTTRVAYADLHAIARAGQGLLVAAGDGGTILGLGAVPLGLRPRPPGQAEGGPAASRLRKVIRGRQAGPASGLRTIEGRSVAGPKASTGVGAGIYVGE